MNSSCFFFRYQQAVLHYQVYGSGRKKMLCFHGFGQHAAYFQALGEKLSNDYTLISIDLFYHGRSSWPDCETALTPDSLSELIIEFLKHLELERFSICGYSLGGKITLNLIEKLAACIDEVLLIAPDGIQTNFWYSMATYPYWMRRLFHYTIRHPQLFFGLSSGMKKLGILHKGVLKFARTQMNTQAKREKVYCTWLTYRKIRPNISKVAYQINQHQIRTTIFLGYFDRIITQKSTEPLLRHIHHYDLHILQTGHNTLINDVALTKEAIF